MNKPRLLLALSVFLAVPPAAISAGTGINDSLVVVILDRTPLISSQYEDSDLTETRQKTLENLVRRLQREADASGDSAITYQVHLSGWKPSVYQRLTRPEIPLSEKDFRQDVLSLVSRFPGEERSIDAAHKLIMKAVDTLPSRNYETNAWGRSIEPVAALINIIRDAPPGKIELYVVSHQISAQRTGRDSIVLQNRSQQLPELVALRDHLVTIEEETFQDGLVRLTRYKVDLPKRPYLKLADTYTLEDGRTTSLRFSLDDWKDLPPLFKVRDAPEAMNWQYRLAGSLDGGEPATGWQRLSHDIAFDPQIQKLEGKDPREEKSAVIDYRISLRGQIAEYDGIENLSIPVAFSYRVSVEIEIEDFYDRFGLWLVILLSAATALAVGAFLVWRARTIRRQKDRDRVREVQSIASQLIKIGPSVYLDDNALRRRDGVLEARSINKLTEDPMADFNTFTVSFPLYQDDDLLLVYDVEESCDNELVTLRRETRSTDDSLDLQLTLSLPASWDAGDKDSEVLELSFKTRLSFESPLVDYRGQCSDEYPLQLHLVPIL